LSADEYFSIGAAETDRAKARTALWKVDFILIDVLSIRDCEAFDLVAVRKGGDPINGVFCEE
jgi:hypothetical protein